MPIVLIDCTSYGLGLGHDVIITRIDILTRKHATRWIGDSPTGFYYA